VIIAILPLDILLFLVAWAYGAIPLWVAGAIVVLTASAPLTLTHAIRAAEKEAAKPDQVDHFRPRTNVCSSANR
jgi:hypothetical protein